MAMPSLKIVEGTAPGEPGFTQKQLEQALRDTVSLFLGAPSRGLQEEIATKLKNVLEGFEEVRRALAKTNEGIARLNCLADLANKKTSPVVRLVESNEAPSSAGASSAQETTSEEPSFRNWKELGGDMGKAELPCFFRFREPKPTPASKGREIARFSAKRVKGKIRISIVSGDIGVPHGTWCDQGFIASVLQGEAPEPEGSDPASVLARFILAKFRAKPKPAAEDQAAA